MEFAITAHRVVQATFRSCKRWRVENDQIILGLRFLSGTQELEDALFDPFHLELSSRRISHRSGDVRGTFFHAGDLERSAPGASQGKCSLICETIQHASAPGILRNGLVVLPLIEIKTGLLPVQKIRCEL